MKLKAVLFMLAALTLDVTLQTAQASTLDSADYSASVLYSGDQLVQGEQAYTTTLQVPQAGELFLTLTDLMPAAFSSLQFTLADTIQSQPLLSGPGTLTMQVSGPETLYAQVFADAQDAADLGLYNLTASLLSSAPVPLPATGALLAAVMLLAGLLELVFRRRTRAVVTTVVA